MLIMVRNQWKFFFNLLYINKNNNNSSLCKHLSRYGSLKQVITVLITIKNNKEK